MSPYYFSTASLVEKTGVFGAVEFEENKEITPSQIFSLVCDLSFSLSLNSLRVELPIFNFTMQAIAFVVCFRAFFIALE